MKPTYKIIINDGGSPEYTVETDVVNIHTHEILTSGIGTFSFTLPTMKGDAYFYEDVALHDRVKIYLGYGTLGAGDLITVGKIYQIGAPASVADGYVRVFICKNQGEVLQRRIKGRKVWEATEADDIVDEVADDLSLGKTDIATETNTVDITADKITYYDLLRIVSDYWVNGGTQLKYDFYVNTDNDLVWKARPIRTAGVETLGLSDLPSYQVTRNALNIKNFIDVYGKKEPYNPRTYGSSVLYPTMQGRTYPSGGDDWTFGAGWTDTEGTSATHAGAPQVGASCLRVTTDNPTGDFDIERSWATGIQDEGYDGFPMLEMWIRRDVTLAGGTHDVRLWAPDDTNYFHLPFTDPGVNGVWKLDVHALGNRNTYDASTNPDGEWLEQGSPVWYDLKGIQFIVRVGAGTWNVDFDGLCFSYARWHDSASDATSQSNYGRRDLLMVDDDLQSNAECEQRAETLLYQLKDPVVRMDETTKLNTNILIGDRLSMTIPAENISAANYDVVAVDHYFNKDQGASTKASMVNSANVRDLPPVTVNEVLTDRLHRQRLTTRGIRAVASSARLKP